jgi:hypothetical protein
MVFSIVHMIFSLPSIQRIGLGHFAQAPELGGKETQAAFQLGLAWSNGTIKR